MGKDRLEKNVLQNKPKELLRLRLHLALAERHIQGEGTSCLQASLHRKSPSPCAWLNSENVLDLS